MDDELELAHRVEASDVGDGTLTRLELAVDALATAYHRLPPAVLLTSMRSYLAYVGHLMNARMQISEQRRLFAVGGWLSLLAATCHIDLDHASAAHARLNTARTLAGDAGHPEILAWCAETRAWQALTAGNYAAAVELARAAQRVAPADGSALIQATAQEGRAWARLGKAKEARDALTRVERLVAPLHRIDQPEHHYHYDPAKFDAYAATTLSWMGDPAAVPLARSLLTRMESPNDGSRPRPRRAASARLDLALALVAGNQSDEAADTALTAVTSGVLVPSNYWRATEVISAIERSNTPTAELQDAYRQFCAPPAPETPVCQ